MMVDKIFSEVAYKAKSKEDIIHGFEEFLDQLTVISPVESDDHICIEPPTTSPLQERRKLKSKDEYHAQIDDTLVRTGRFFGGLINDVKRKIPFYTSDFKNGVHIQSIGTIFYLYLATLTLNITCGYLMGIMTDNYMATTECLLAAAFVNIAFALFGGQPLVIMGVSFQLFAIELIISRFCRDYSWDYLSFRCMIGLWLALYLLIIVAFDLSVIVRYITRFTQEIFTCVMASIFIIYESVTRLSRYPSNTYHNVPFCTCTCVPDNQTETMYTPYMNFNSTIYGFMQENSSIKNEVCAKLENVLEGSGRDTQIDNSDVRFLPILLCIGTFIIAWKLVEIKQSRFFPTVVRHAVGDFSVFIAICSMVLVDALLREPTPKLSQYVPAKIQLSYIGGREWFIRPYNPSNPWWTMLLAALPAFVTLKGIFMDQHITAVIINRKENNLKKGFGYHLDLTVATICIVVCSLFGLPWHAAVTVPSISHANSLKIKSKCMAAGEKQVVLGCSLCPCLLCMVYFYIWEYQLCKECRKGMDKIFRMDELTWLDNQNLEDEMMKQEDSGDDQSTNRKLNPTGNISWYLKHDKTFTGLSKEDIVNDFPVEFLRNCRSQSTI
ncbi:sodium bicarbonate cotransporter 3-like isoform X4 [Mytilus galloprovincialis]|uniref:sodium bicarbonate cotransporter 3-like isoform X4 n=1 Tax=Mytilus galloprovincialis TaxID=29158 RepID=UPI003F7B9E93